MGVPANEASVKSDFICPNQMQNSNTDTNNIFSGFGRRKDDVCTV